MIRWLLYLPAKLVMTLLALAFAGRMVRQAERRYGPLDNDKAFGTEPRLPEKWWRFDTPDNSLYGDAGWRTKHCPDAWQTPAGMARWLRRNPALGFCWVTLGHLVTPETEFTISGTPGVDKGQDRYGWYLIRSNDGAFQFRFAYAVLGVEIAGDFGWLLEPFLDPHYRTSRRALYQCSPKMPRRVGRV